MKTLPPNLNPASSQAAGKARGFTLIELLVVVAVMAVLMVLIVPAMTGINNNASVTKAAYDIDGLLDQARAYAMANNDYVFVGIEEVNAAVASSAPVQSPATATAGGSLALIVVASKDGTSNPANSNLTVLQKLARYDNLHLADFTGQTAASGPMSARAPIDGTTSLSLGNPSTTSTNSIVWPLGATTAQYTFTKIIQFDSQGGITISGIPTIPQYIEIALQQTHGNAVPPAPANLASGNQVAIQADGITGSLHIYRP